MSTTELRALLDQVADTRELVLRRAASLGPAFNAVLVGPRHRHKPTLRTWLGSGSATAYVVYRAAQDREDAAQDALAVTG